MAHSWGRGVALEHVALRKGGRLLLKAARTGAVSDDADERTVWLKTARMPAGGFRTHVAKANVRAGDAMKWAAQGGRGLDHFRQIYQAPPADRQEPQSVTIRSSWSVDNVGVRTRRIASVDQDRLVAAKASGTAAGLTEAAIIEALLTKIVFEIKIKEPRSAHARSNYPRDRGAAPAGRDAAELSR
jgi:hypothetical protein